MEWLCAVKGLFSTVSYNAPSKPHAHPRLGFLSAGSTRGLCLFCVVPLHMGLGSPPGYQTCRVLPGAHALLGFFSTSPSTSPLSLSSHIIRVWLDLTAFRSVHTFVMLFANCALKSERNQVWLVEDDCMQPAFSGMPRNSSIWS